MNTFMDFVQIWYTDRTHKDQGSFRKWARHIKKHGCQAAIFENGYRALINECLNGYC